MTTPAGARPGDVSPAPAGRRRRIGVLAGGTVIAACASLSVHAFMLDGLHVPYPYDLPRMGPATWPAWFLLAYAAIGIHRVLRAGHPAWSARLRIAVVFLLLAGLKEDLVRAWLMDVVNGNPPTVFPVLRDGVPKWVLLGCASLGGAAAVALVGDRTGRGRVGRDVGAACAVGFAVSAASAALDATWGRLLVHLSFLDTPSRWNPPYDWHILVPAYVTAIEPAIAAVALGLLARPALPRAGTRFLWLVGMVVLVKGHLVEPFLNILYARVPAPLAVLSVGQFTLEGLALALLAAGTLEGAERAGRGP